MAWDGQPNPYSVLQHALLLSLRTLLASPAGDKSKLECFAQDPLYTDQDKLALADSGIVVLDEPKGFLEVDDFTIVLSIGPDVPVKQIIADISRPAVIIRDEHEDTTPSDAAILRTTPDLHEFWRCFRATIRGLGSRSARNSGYWEFTSEIRMESK